MIETERLTKRYGHLLAVDELSFTVGQGEVLGFLGPNGAGKSTTMKMLSGFLSPTSGSARICGYDVETQSVAAKRRIGYLPEGAPSYGEMTPRTFLDFIADIRDLRDKRKAERLDEVIDRLHLEPVLILDEPTDGLDPNQKHEVRSLIREMAADKIIIISTHILEEVHAVCNRAIIIAHGRILADDTPDALEARSDRHNAVTLRLAGTPADDARAALEALDGVGRVEIRPDQSITVLPQAGASVLPAVGRLALEQGWQVDALQIESGQLDEVFRQITMADSGPEART